MLCPWEDVPNNTYIIQMAAGEDPSKPAWGTLVAPGVNAQVGPTGTQSALSCLTSHAQ